MNCTLNDNEQFSGIDMISPTDKNTSNYIADLDNEYRKFSLNIDVSNPISFSTCLPNDVKVTGK